MRIAWSLPVIGERLGSTRGDLVRAASLIDALRADGHDVRVVQDAASGAGVAVAGYRRWVKRIAPRRVGLVLRDLGRVGHFRAHGEEVARIVRQHRAELLVETQVGYSASGAQASRATGVPLVLDDCAPTREEVEAGCGLASLARSALADGFFAARAIVAPSRAIATELVAEGAPASRVRVVSNGVNLDAFARADRAAFRAKASFGRRDVIVFAGSFQRWHRVDLLVSAFASLEHRDSILVLLGTGPERDHVIAQSQRLGVFHRIVAPGGVAPAEIPSWLVAADVGVLPGSNDYGHPMKLVEYAAAGLARVAPDLEAVREIVTNDEDGLLFGPGDAGSLAARIDILLTDTSARAALGDAAKARVAGASWASKARELID